MKKQSIGFIQRLRILLGQDDPFEVFARNQAREESDKELKDNDLAKKVASGEITSPPARSTEPEAYQGPFQHRDMVLPEFAFDVIHEIRCLAINNASVSQALNNIINLANTGHELEFDSSVSAEQAAEMKAHIDKHVTTWHYGIADTNALASKLFMQLFIAGAIAEEVVLDDDLRGIKRVLMPKPETIRFVYNHRKVKYEPYQVRKNLFRSKRYDASRGLVKLNEASFRYYTLNTDVEAPYGYPPYLPAIEPLNDQKLMISNINFIIQQMGVVGFLELLVDKPDIQDGESDIMYKKRLDAYLADCKRNISKSTREGIVVGYQEDHEFKFHSATKGANGVAELFSQNELIVHSGLKQDPSLSGKATQGGEGYINVIFTKLISELRNAQSVTSKALEHIYQLELRLRGFSFKTMRVKFKPSTIQDDLKTEQAKEIKIRNASKLWQEGVISKDRYAQMVGESKSHNQKTPEEVMIKKEGSTGDPNLDAQKKAVREKEKDASDRKVRSKNKPGSATKQ